MTEDFLNKNICAIIFIISLDALVCESSSILLSFLFRSGTRPYVSGSSYLLTKLD